MEDLEDYFQRLDARRSELDGERAEGEASAGSWLPSWVNPGLVGFGALGGEVRRGRLPAAGAETRGVRHRMRHLPGRHEHRGGCRWLGF